MTPRLAAGLLRSPPSAVVGDGGDLGDKKNMAAGERGDPESSLSRAWSLAALSVRLTGSLSSQSVIFCLLFSLPVISIELRKRNRPKA